MHTKILKIEIERESEKSVWIKGYRCLKKTECEEYFDTWEQAYNQLVIFAEKRISITKLNLVINQEELEAVKKIKET